ncbi:MAG: hypothetical protein Kow0040_10480 [Thermogutta sp.]
MVPEADEVLNEQECSPAAREVLFGQTKATVFLGGLEEKPLSQGLDKSAIDLAFIGNGDALPERLSGRETE